MGSLQVDQGGGEGGGGVPKTNEGIWENDLYKD
jgi:hypothetical protein